MTNLDGPRGFTVVHAGKYRHNLYAIDTGVATAIYPGDLVSMTGDTLGEYPGADVMSAASDDYVGPVTALYNTAWKPVSTLAASTAGYALVCDDPDAVLEVQTDDGGTALTGAATGDCTDAIWTHAGSGSRAGVELDESTLAGNGADAQFRILYKAHLPNNDYGEHYIRFHVVAHEHAFNTTSFAI